MLANADEFVRFRRSEEPSDYERAAHDEASLDTWLEVITRFPEMRVWVAENKTVPMEILARLVEDDDARVRWMVARKRKLEPDLLQALARDPSDDVRLAVARHRSTPRSVLESLAADDAWSEVRLVARGRLRP